MLKIDLYSGREQTLVKHVFLENCLCRFAHKIGTKWDVITYVDCFSGPWNENSNDYSDTSFYIAIGELRKARDTLKKSFGRDLKLRCFFTESDAVAFRKLEQFRSGIPDVEIETANEEFKSAIPLIQDFCRRGGGSNFNFFFVDPLSVVEAPTLTPLLRDSQSEVLVNFITSHARRFYTDEKFDVLCGTTQHFDYSGLPDDTVRAMNYADALQRCCGYRYVSTAVVLHPQKRTQFFHLIYGTRHTKGLEVFKEAEHKAMRHMESSRIAVRNRNSPADPQVKFEFMAAEEEEDRFFKQVESSHLAAARVNIERFISDSASRPVVAAWSFAMKFPFVTQRQLHIWLDEAKSKGLLQGPIPPVGKKVNWSMNEKLIWTAKKQSGRI